ncbi:hypothetical protein BC941DRAFT_457406 [Chlamydoabsidia padenii]|nr:hypothetical protein BC941DRAFT_457406 [Chlamydoabsidia padenii]
MIDGAGSGSGDFHNVPVEQVSVDKNLLGDDLLDADFLDDDNLVDDAVATTPVPVLKARQRPSAAMINLAPIINIFIFFRRFVLQEVDEPDIDGHVLVNLRVIDMCNAVLQSTDYGRYSRKMTSEPSMAKSNQAAVFATCIDMEKFGKLCFERKVEFDNKIFVTSSGIFNIVKSFSRPPTTEQLAKKNAYIEDCRHKKAALYGIYRQVLHVYSDIDAANKKKSAIFDQINGTESLAVTPSTPTLTPEGYLHHENSVPLPVEEYLDNNLEAARQIMRVDQKEVSAKSISSKSRTSQNLFKLQAEKKKNGNISLIETQLSEIGKKKLETGDVIKAATPSTASPSTAATTSAKKGKGNKHIHLPASTMAMLVEDLEEESSDTRKEVPIGYRWH